MIARAKYIKHEKNFCLGTVDEFGSVRDEYDQPYCIWDSDEEGAYTSYDSYSPSIKRLARGKNTEDIIDMFTENVPNLTNVEFGMEEVTFTFKGRAKSNFAALKNFLEDEQLLEILKKTTEVVDERLDEPYEDDDGYEIRNNNECHEWVSISNKLYLEL